MATIETTDALIVGAGPTGLCASLREVLSQVLQDGHVELDAFRLTRFRAGELVEPYCRIAVLPYCRHMIFKVSNKAFFFFLSLPFVLAPYDKKPQLFPKVSPNGTDTTSKRQVFAGFERKWQGSAA